MIEHDLRGANWQRSGGKGAAPQRLTRPDDRPPKVKTGDELRNRRAAQQAELARRRNRKQRGA